MEGKKTVGIIRSFDDLGRIVIPKEIRRRLGIVEGDRAEIFPSEDGILLRLHPPADSVKAHFEAVKSAVWGKAGLERHDRETLLALIAALEEELTKKLETERE